MSIFNEIHSSNSIGSWKTYDELVRSLEELIEQGRIKEVSPSRDMTPQLTERWFVDNQSGVVFRLVDPEPPAFGEWSEVEFPKGGRTV